MTRRIEGPVILTSSGAYFDYLHPENSVFTIEDIARSLSKLCRFTGHCVSFYSVAQHSVMVSLIVPGEDALAGLLHDAHEFAIGDMNSPLKALCPDYVAVDKKVKAAVRARFGLPAVLPPTVKHADLVMLATEKRDLMPGNDAWALLEGIEPMGARVTPFSPQIAYDAFMSRYRYLMRH